MFPLFDTVMFVLAALFSIGAEAKLSCDVLVWNKYNLETKQRFLNSNF